jgi:hypothetical protein
MFDRIKYIALLGFQKTLITKYNSYRNHSTHIMLPYYASHKKCSINIAEETF